MHKTVLTALVALLISSSAWAQTPTRKTSKLQWDQVATDVGNVTQLSARLYIDGSLEGVVLDKTCTTTDGTAFVCTASMPALTPGLHSLVLSVMLGAEESAKSDALSILLVVVQTPTALRIVQ